MSILYLCNIGLRDLLLEGQSLRPCRIEGQKALGRYDELKSKFTAPIIRPGIDFVLSRHSHVDRMILFATDQSPAVGERFWENDTLHAAEILRKLLLSKYNTGKTTKLREVKVKLIREQNPSQYDEMYGYFGKQMATKDLRPEGVEHCYVAPAGGTPSANTGLILHAVAAFGGKCEVISVSEATGFAHPVQIGGQLRKAVKKEIIAAHLASGSFAAALALLEEIDAAPLARHLACYAKHRLFFDFDEAERAIVEAIEIYSGAERLLCQRLREDLRALAECHDEALILEVYYNAAVAYAGQQYVDFLGRAFRFQEAVLEAAVRRIYGVALDGDTETHRERLRQLAGGNAWLKAHLDAASVNGNHLVYSRVNIPVLRELLKYAVIRGGGVSNSGAPLLSEETSKTYGELHAILEKMGHLAQLRDHCIISHGFKGVSKDILRREYNKRATIETDPVEDMGEAVRLLGVETPANPFERIRQEILAKLEES